METQTTEAVSAKLIAYLRGLWENPALDVAEPMARLHGGFETASYQLTLENQPTTLPASLVLRLYPASFGQYPATWEAAIQNSLHGQDYPVAQVYHVCTDLSVLGGAFILMDFVAGKPLGLADPDLIPGLLGTLHAGLHNREYASLEESLRTQGIDPARCILDHSVSRYEETVAEFPWLSEILDWIREHTPNASKSLCACHGDFHPMNIMVNGDEVTAVLDWGGFSFADANSDIGNTLVLLTIPYKHLGAALPGAPSFDTEAMARTYLEAYQKIRPIDFSSLDYYRLRRCVLALIQGVQGQQLWQHPGIVRDILTTIQDISGVSIKKPV